MWNHEQQDNYKAFSLVIITDFERGGHNLFTQPMIREMCEVGLMSHLFPINKKGWTQGQLL